MTSNLISSINCPKCGKVLHVAYSRNDMKVIANCTNCTFMTKIEDCEYIYLKQYFKANNYVEGE